MKKIIAFILLLGFSIGCEKSILTEDATTVAEPALKSVCTITVPDDYLTIQEAVNAASDGCTITIKEGAYKELVVIHYKNDITLIGEGALICPPDDIINGVGFFILDIFGCSNIKILNLKFNGMIEGKTYPIDRAINYAFSSGEASNNKFSGFNTGIACLNLFEEPYPGPGQSGDMLSAKFSNNKFSDCFGAGILIIGNYDVDIDKNIISQSFDPDNPFYYLFWDWYGIEMNGGTGIISKNNITIKTGTYPGPIAGILLMMREPAPHLFGMMHYLHDVDVTKNIIKRTDIGILINSPVPLYPIQDPVEEWCVHNVSLLNNQFIQVENHYEIYNECEDITIIPPWIP